MTRAKRQPIDESSGAPKATAVGASPSVPAAAVERVAAVAATLPTREDGAPSAAATPNSQLATSPSAARVDTEARRPSGRPGERPAVLPKDPVLAPESALAADTALAPAPSPDLDPIAFTQVAVNDEMASLADLPEDVNAKDTGHERRSAPRVSVDVEIGFASETNFYTGFSEDISEGGIFVATYNVLPMGAQLELSFVLPDGHAVSATGIVTWLREPQGLASEITPGMGIAFQSLIAPDRDAIHRFLAQRAPLFYDN